MAEENGAGHVTANAAENSTMSDANDSSTTVELNKSTTSNASKTQKGGSKRKSSSKTKGSNASTAAKRAKLSAASSPTPTTTTNDDGSSVKSDRESTPIASSSSMRKSLVGSSSQAARVNAAVAEEEPDQEHLYCVCKKPYDNSNLMIACDICDEWYHPVCLKIKEFDVPLFNMFVCPTCHIATGRKTTLKKKCARPRCPEAAQPLSKYCSDYCGVLVASTRIEQSKHKPISYWSAVRNAKRREGIVTKENVPKNANNKENNNNKDQDRHEENGDKPAGLVALETSLQKIVDERRRVESQMGLVKSRLRMLSRAVERWESACYALVEEPTSSSHPNGGQENNNEQEDDNKKDEEEEQQQGQEGQEQGETSTNNNNNNKKNKRSKRRKHSKKQAKTSPTNLPNAPCGYDFRLSWDDAEWAAWVQSDLGQAILASRVDDPNNAAQNLICDKTKKKCERHSGWAKTREAEFDLDRAGLLRKLDRLTSQERKIRTSIEDWEPVKMYSNNNENS